MAFNQALCHCGKSQSNGLLREVLSDYLDLPCLIFDQICKILDPDNRGYIVLEAFLKFFASLALGTLKEKVSIIFDM